MIKDEISKALAAAMAGPELVSELSDASRPEEPAAEAMKAAAKKALEEVIEELKELDGNDAGEVVKHKEVLRGLQEVIIEAVEGAGRFGAG